MAALITAASTCVLNVLGFLPLGFVMVPAMPSRLARGTCVLLTVLLLAAQPRY